ncbi:MAG TPA: adenylate kinase family protein [Candidatus Thermoplasmatota archaeon]|nr:adenylate kinase family protein [Candidatus Thermoplasmatota archaeon]
MRLALTGVPGTGKTTLAESLGRTCRIIHLNELAKEAGLLSEMDEKRGSYLVDMDDLSDALNAKLEGERGPVVVEGHFAHEMDVDSIVLLRCDPLVLLDRLRARGWAEDKVRENVEAEALDVLAQEVLDVGLPAVELDVSTLSVEDAASRVWAIAEGGPKALKGTIVGSANWSLEALPWF